MNLDEYRLVRDEKGYREELTYIWAGELTLKEFLNYKSLDLQVKIHLSKVIISRHFSSTGGVALPADLDWFIDGFLSEFDNDLIKPWIGKAIKESIEMIVSDDHFCKGIIGTTFMFGVVEFYVKYLLGYRPEKLDPFDHPAHEPYRKMFLSDAINRLKKTNTDLARDINEIDNHNVSSLKESGILEKRHVKARMADRLNFPRNTMVHGESHSFYDKGKYLVMIYILFHFHGLRAGVKYEGN